MVKDVRTVYKFIVLYMLNAVEYPISNSNISDFVISRGYTNDYFMFQSVIGDLTDSGLVVVGENENKSLYSITENGRKTLEYFPNELNNELKSDILEYLKENEHRLKVSIEVLADYKRLKSGNYEAKCVLMEGKEMLLEIAINVPTEALAFNVCKNWKEKNESVYQNIVAQLF